MGPVRVALLQSNFLYTGRYQAINPYTTMVDKETTFCTIFMNWYLGNATLYPRSRHTIYDRIWQKGQFRAKRDFLLFFKLSPHQGYNSPRLLTWFVGSLGLLLHRSNIRSYSKPPVPRSEPPKWGIKLRFSNAIDASACPAHTGNGRGLEFRARVAGW